MAATLTELAPRWAQPARSIVIQYDPTQLIIEALERLHERGTTRASIDDVVREACRMYQPPAVEVFFTRTRRKDVLTADGNIDNSQLTDLTVYKSGIHFQFNTTCTTSGSSPLAVPTSNPKFSMTRGRFTNQLAQDRIYTHSIVELCRWTYPGSRLQPDALNTIWDPQIIPRVL